MNKFNVCGTAIAALMISTLPALAEVGEDGQPVDCGSEICTTSGGTDTGNTSTIAIEQDLNQVLNQTCSGMGMDSDGNHYMMMGTNSNGDCVAVQTGGNSAHVENSNNSGGGNMGGGHNGGGNMGGGNGGP
jgi:hypothetical protein